MQPGAGQGNQPRPWGSECAWVKEPVRDDSALGCNCQTPLTLLRLYVTSGWDSPHPQVMAQLIPPSPFSRQSYLRFPHVQDTCRRTMLCKS